MFFVINIIGIIVVFAIAYLCSRDRRKVDFTSVAIMLVIQLIITWFMLSTTIGGDIIQLVAKFFLWLINCSMSGIRFVFGSLVPATGMAPFLISVLMPIIFIVAFFDILTYFGILPAIINTLGWVLSKITRSPRFESFFATQVMFLGNNEVLAITRDQLNKMDDKRLLTACMLGMSCVSVGVLGGYMQMINPKYVLIAIPLNAVGALIITSLLNPYKVTPEEDVVYNPVKSDKRRNFFDMLTDSMMTGGRMALIIAAMLMGFTALITCSDSILSLINKNITLENIFAVIFSPFTFLMGVTPSQIFTVAQFMGEKLATNEFIAMGSLHPILHTLNRHTEAVISTFLVSFCNFSTVGIILGSVKSLFSEEKGAFIAKNTWRLLVSGILVSFLTAMVVGLFVW
ncbi:nucleoside transporter C-terminal domain-containing protein [Aneurinibacillus sp. Ricciae_BoGa-3]|uniref:NupC/NupG family nucleoside CNT transporter n=1 Tax=Aneurinibacillus sp. Ricciae_BoGa-3 TaxID=3022697 RepID=UPI00234206A2|nr:nucleoside transporter C-terminal domain-containing protein [Aneurinibacillus sp. Ricciae_BoGa-3]WCK56624.1 nucleoside transporter C-terminal domain-containing protein [Aneurinibacillus sp. Ricciae_BoGa-3]